MKEQSYTYSLLTYKHSALLGESLNIGLLIYFEEEERFFFDYSKRLSRIKSVYSHISEKTIKHYLKQIFNKVNTINDKVDDFLKIDIQDSFDSFLSEYLLPFDGSSLQFTKGSRNFQYEKSSQSIISYLTDLYLFENEKYTLNKEYELTKSFYNSIKDVIDIHIPYFHKDYKVKRSTGAEFTFAYAWENGSMNLIKPLNFDLSEANYIARKTNENYGLIVGLEKQAKENNFRYDFLVGKPTKKELFKEYDNSINFLSELDRIKIIEEQNIIEYANKAAKSLSKKINKI